jgi:hypothetical protein
MTLAMLVSGVVLVVVVIVGVLGYTIDRSVGDQ